MRVRWTASSKTRTCAPSSSAASVPAPLRGASTTSSERSTTCASGANSRGAPTDRYSIPFPTTRSQAMSTVATDPIPVRALNQVTYCPRLYYLQYVDAVVPVNEHIEGGLFDHRRVDSADLANKTRKDGATSTSRGIALSSETLGISGILDVIEER